MQECWRIPMMKFHLLREVNERKVSKRMGLLYWKRNCCGFFDFSVVQKENFADIKIGISNANEREKKAVEDVYQLLRGAKVDCVAAEDIEAEIWRKYIFNCAYNVLTAHYRQNVGELRADAKKREEFRRLLQEAYEVGKAKGVHLEEEDIVRHQNRFENKLADDATSSLQRDVEGGERAWGRCFAHREILQDGFVSAYF